MNSDKKETVNDIIGFQEEIANIQTAIADFECGHNLNIAIIAEPFAGRTTLLNEIEKMNQYKVTRLSFSSIVKNIDDVKLSEQSKRIVLIDDCQYLYERKIGGFEILECFLKSAVSSSHLFADIIGGIVITFEKHYQVGDKIKIGDYYGEVSDIGIRATKLVTPDDNLVSAPNYLIFTQAVASANAGAPEMMVVIDLFLDSDAVLAMKLLKESVATSKYVYISKKRPFTVLLKDYPFYRRLRAKAYVNDLRYEFEFESEVTRRAWIEFSKNGIKAPNVNILEAGTISQAK
jgi:hypothetical protein